MKKNKLSLSEIMINLINARKYIERYNLESVIKKNYKRFSSREIHFTIRGLINSGNIFTICPDKFGRKQTHELILCSKNSNHQTLAEIKSIEPDFVYDEESGCVYIPAQITFPGERCMKKYPCALAALYDLRNAKKDFESLREVLMQSILNGTPLERLIKELRRYKHFQRNDIAKGLEKLKKEGLICVEKDCIGRECLYKTSEFYRIEIEE